jgi:hypothetical protein
MVLRISFYWYHNIFICFYFCMIATVISAPLIVSQKIWDFKTIFTMVYNSVIIKHAQ